MRYKINVTFSGTASLELDADTPEAARLLAAELALADLARTGHADILSWKVAARETTPISALSGQAEEGSAESQGSPRARPSGWYRPK